MTPMRPRLSVSLACLTAVLALSACGTPGSSGGSVSQPSGAVSTGFDTSKKVTLTMWDTENATGPVEGGGRADPAVRAEVPERDRQARRQELRRLHGHDQAGGLVQRRPGCLPGQRGRGRPGAGEGAPDRAAGRLRQGLRLGHPVRQLGRAEPAALVVGRQPVGRRPAVGHRAEGRGGGSLLQQGHPEAAGPAGADHVRPSSSRAWPRPSPRACRRSWSATSTAGRWATSSWCCRRGSTRPHRISNWTYGHAGATFDTAGTRKAASVLQQWGDKGYFEDGFNGVSQENAAARFGKGEGLYFITGPWENQTFAGPLERRRRLLPAAVPGRQRREHPPPARCRCRTTSARTSQNPAVAAAFINFITDPQRGQDRDRQRRPAGREPGGGGGRSQLVAGSDLGRLGREVQGGHAHARTSTGPRPTMGDTLFGGLQQLSESRETPADFAAAVQKDWEKTHS